MEIKTNISNFMLHKATESDVPIILSFIHEFATYEKLAHEVVATEDSLCQSLFGNRKVAEVIIGFYKEKPVSFALFFHNFSTFLGKPGIYLEDLYIKPEMRGKSLGKSMLSYIAQIACDRDCGRFEWCVLDWNKSALKFYSSMGATPMNEWTTQRLEGKALQKLANKF